MPGTSAIKVGAILFFFSGVLFSGCGPLFGLEPKEHYDELRAKLAAVPLTEELTIPEDFGACEARTAATNVKLGRRAPHWYYWGTDLSADSAVDVWNSCQRMYACSPSVARWLRETPSAVGGRFRIGITDLDQMKTRTRISEGTITGLYPPGSGNIYLDSDLKQYFQICSTMLHELIHRFDPAANSGENSLRTEFHAYWFQTAFEDDLYLLDGWGERMKKNFRNGCVNPRENSDRICGFVSHRGLLLEKARVYQFNPDFSLLEKYGLFPMERYWLDGAGGWLVEALEGLYGRPERDGAAPESDTPIPGVGPPAGPITNPAAGDTLRF